jgi:RimJ/RimL family protein N-acetyltransferase
VLRLLTQAEADAAAQRPGFEELNIATDFAGRALAADPGYGPWSVRLLLLKPSLQPIGHIRFHSRPVEGAVEFGYTVFTPWRCRGFATEAAAAAMRWAVEQHGVRRFIASVRTNNLPSQRVVAKLGFRKVGQQLDEIDGIEDVFERQTRQNVL